MIDTLFEKWETVQVTMPYDYIIPLLDPSCYDDIVYEMI